MTAVVPQHALGYFLARGVLLPGDSMMGKPLVPEVPSYVQRYSDFFAELVCQQADFQHYSPSLAAAAIVVATRRAVNLLPNWNPALEGVLGYSADAVQRPFLHLWLHYAEAFPAQTAVTDGQFADSVSHIVQATSGLAPLQALQAVTEQQAKLGLAAAGSTAGPPTPEAAINISVRTDASGVSACSEASSQGADSDRRVAWQPHSGARHGRVATFNFSSPTPRAASGGGERALAASSSNPYLSSARVGAGGGPGLHSAASAASLGGSSRAALGAQPVNSFGSQLSKSQLGVAAPAVGV